MLIYELSLDLCANCYYDRDALFEGPVLPSNTLIKFLPEVKKLLFGCLSVSRLGDTALSKGLSRRKGAASDMGTLQ